MSDLRFPDPETVAVAWLKRDTSFPVATSLPAAVPTTGFVQVTTVAGSPNAYVDLRNPLIQVDVWVGTNNSSNNPPWGTASALAERVRLVLADMDDNQPITLPGFYPFFVHSVYMASEPRRFSDDRGYARFSMDAEMYWTTFNS